MRDQSFFSSKKSVFLLLIKKAACIVSFGGCERKMVVSGTDDFEFATEIRDVITGVCKGSRPCSCGRDPMQSIVSITNNNVRTIRTHMTIEAMPKATFYGNDVHDRENSQSRFHSFREKMAESLYGRKCWDVILELWVAEVESMKKEAEFCRRMMKRSPSEFVT